MGTRGKGPRGQPLAQSTGATAPVRQRKRGPGCVFVALLEPRARRLLPRAVTSVPVSWISWFLVLGPRFDESALQSQ